MWTEGRDTLRELLDDGHVRAVIVTGAGDAFSAGQDLGEMTTAPAGGGEHGFPGFMEALCGFDKPLIAAVNGVGVGIGLTMLLHQAARSFELWTETRRTSISSQETSG